MSDAECRLSFHYATRVFLLAAAVGPIALFSANATGATMSDGFEGSMSKWNYSGNPTTKPSNEEMKSGNYSAKVVLDRNRDKVPSRTEIRPRIGNFSYGKVYRIKFSMFIPNDWETDRFGDTLMQVHAVPDKSDTKKNGPVLALSTESGSWKIVSRSDGNRTSSSNSVSSAQIHKSSYSRNKWTTWELEVKWSYGKDGYMRIWKDGSQVVNRSGPNCYNDSKGPYLKMGIYKPAWKSHNLKDWSSDAKITVRRYYIDDVEISGG